MELLVKKLMNSIWYDKQTLNYMLDYMIQKCFIYIFCGIGNSRIVCPLKWIVNQMHDSNGRQHEQDQQQAWLNGWRWMFLYGLFHISYPVSITHTHRGREKKRERDAYKHTCQVAVHKLFVWLSPTITTKASKNAACR